MARRISRPLEIITAGAGRFGRGELDHRLPLIGSREIAALAEATNDMAAQLQEHIQTLARKAERGGGRLAKHGRRRAHAGQRRAVSSI